MPITFNSRMLEERGHGYLASILESKGSFIMLPGYREFKDRCIYIGVDFSAVQQKELALNEIGETIRENRYFTAK
jgi:hypothetical protein